MNTDYGLGSLKFQLGAYDLNYGRQYGYEYNVENTTYYDENGKIIKTKP